MEKKLNKREIQAMETHQKLLDTSMQLIISKGYDNVTVSEICAKCNVAKGTFYTYFESKRDIVIKILTDINNELFEHKVWDESCTATEQFMDYIDLYMRSIEEQGAEFTRIFLTVIISEKVGYEAVKADMHEQIVCRIIDRGKERGEFRTDLPSKKIYNYLASLIFGIMMNWSICDNKYSIITKGKEAGIIFLDMLRHV